MSRLILKCALGSFVVSASSLLVGCAAELKTQATDAAVPRVTEQAFDAGHGMKLGVRMVAPYAIDADLQIICVFKHNPAGDKYIEAMQDFDDKLAGLLSAARNRGDFVGEWGETFLFDSPVGSIAPKRVLVIGLGPEGQLSLDTLRLVGRVALREAVRLRAARVAFAPTIRDQGNSTIEVGPGDRIVAEEIILAYDTEKRLQAQGLSPRFDIKEWTIEAGPKFVESAIAEVGKGVAAANAQTAKRSSDPYRRISR